MKRASYAVTHDAVSYFQGSTEGIICDTDLTYVTVLHIFTYRVWQMEMIRWTRHVRTFTVKILGI